MTLKLSVRTYVLLITLGGILVSKIHLNRLDSFSSCSEDCLVWLWGLPNNELQIEVIKHLRENFIDPPQTVLQTPLSIRDYDNPAWKDNGEWEDITRTLKWIFANQTHGSYLEIGAGVGDIMSMTSWLDARSGWKGFLVEPNPESYGRIRRRRRVASANVCISTGGEHHQDHLWVPFIGDEITEPFRSISLMSSRLEGLVASKEVKGGTMVPVQCVKITGLVVAAEPQFLLHKQILHLVIIDTNGGETRILEDLLYYQILILVIRVLTQVEREEANRLAQDRNLTLLTSPEHPKEYAIYIYNQLQLAIKYI